MWEDGVGKGVFVCRVQVVLSVLEVGRWMICLREGQTDASKTRPTLATTLPANANNLENYRPPN